MQSSLKNLLGSFVGGTHSGQAILGYVFTTTSIQIKFEMQKNPYLNHSHRSLFSAGCQFHQSTLVSEKLLFYFKKHLFTAYFNLCGTIYNTFNIEFSVSYHS